MTRPHHFFHTAEQFHQCSNFHLRPLRDSGVFSFMEGLGEGACPIGAVSEPKPCQKPRAHAPLRYIISVNALLWMIIAFVGMNCAIGVEPAQAAESKPVTEYKKFASPEEAIKALMAAVKSGDRDAVHELFGPEVTNLMTGDKVQDAANFKSFSQAVEEKCESERDGENKVFLNIGTEKWPFPIPLVKEDNMWRFDTEAGREEIINRHIGRDELNAIGVCRAYVKAQEKYFNENPDGSGVHQYAQKLKSSAGKKDGLYWPTEGGAEESPLGPLVEEAHAEGYGYKKPGSGPQPFHGYYFKILTRQGPDAAGGKTKYLTHGKMTGGFAMVAYPALWDQSGIMTFIVNQQGMIYQRNLGEETGRVASRMTEYDPDASWTVVQDLGISEK